MTAERGLPAIGEESCRAEQSSGEGAAGRAGPGVSTIWARAPGRLTASPFRRSRRCRCFDDVGLLVLPGTTQALAVLACRRCRRCRRFGISAVSQHRRHGAQERVRASSAGGRRKVRGARAEARCASTGSTGSRVSGHDSICITSRPVPRLEGTPAGLGSNRAAAQQRASFKRAGAMSREQGSGAQGQGLKSRGARERAREGSRAGSRGLGSRGKILRGKGGGCDL